MDTVQSCLPSSHELIADLECAEKWMKKYFDARCVFSVQLHCKILQICILLLLQILIYLDNKVLLLLLALVHRFDNKVLRKKVAKFLYHLSTIIIIHVAINKKMTTWKRCGAEAK